MQKHVILTAVGLVLGLAALVWVAPATNAGATFLVLLIIVVVNAVGALMTLWRDRRADS